MGLLTIGAFARATGLSPKALRLYDELGLLPPAAVDGETGYRFYDPAQAERARLIAWLRRLGMPLARVREVCEAGGGEQAAELVAAYWQQVRAETTARGRLAAFLVEQLSGREPAMDDPNTALSIRYAARCEPGLARTTNEDTVYAGSRLLAVADGMRGGELTQITHDHTWVQTLVDDGRLTAQEAAAHPRRALLARALTGNGRAEPDLSLHDATPGDRYVLCSDGLSAVVPAPALRGVLRAADGPQQALDDLMALAYAHGAPDNVACVVADVEAG